jgi:membrane protease YdiL (CAAX protease family)
MNQPKLGAAIALPAYLVLIAGMGIIGVQAQTRDVVSGLWITEAVAIALPALFVLCVAGVRVAPYLGLRKLTAKHALIAVVLAALNQPVVSFLTWVCHEMVPQSLVEEFDAQQRLLNTLFVGRSAALMLFTVIAAAPLGEELFFRGYLLPSLRKSWGLPAALIVSSALFSLVHLEWVGFLGLMEIGLLLAALRLWTGSLWAAVLGHAVNNAFAGVAFWLGYQDPDLPTPGWVLALGGVLSLFYLVLLVRVVQKAQPFEEEHAPRRTSTSVVLAAVWSIAIAAGLWGYRQGSASAGAEIGEGRPALRYPDKE